jgi:hypothetical protein
VKSAGDGLETPSYRVDPIFRPAQTAVRMIFDWLGIDVKVPSFDSIRVWACRVGIAPLKRPVRDGEAWILGFINRHGVYHGAAAKLKIELDEVRTTHPPRCELHATMAESSHRLPRGRKKLRAQKRL